MWEMASTAAFARTIRAETPSPIIPLAIIQPVRRTPSGRLLLLLLIVVFALFLHVAVGSSQWIAPGAVLKELLSGDQGMTGSVDNGIIWHLRLSRAVGCGLVGLLLGAVGAAFQSLFRNPLAEPYVVGVSSGAAVGGTAAIWAGVGSFFFGLGAMVFAFLGGMAALILVMFLGRRRGAISVPTVLLSGVVLGSVLSGVLSWILVASGQDTNRLVEWLLGTTSNMNWSKVAMLTVAAAIGTPILIFQARRLNTLSVGEESASRLGIDTKRLTGVVLMTGSAMTAFAVGSAGIIGFVGLVGPHIARRALGSDMRWSLAGSAFLGAALLLLSDIVAQRAIPHSEVPLGAVTAVLGAPVLLALLKKKD